MLTKEEMEEAINRMVPWFIFIHSENIEFGDQRGFLPNLSDITRIISHLKTIKRKGQKGIDEYNRIRMMELHIEQDELNNAARGYTGPKKKGFIYFAKKGKYVKIGRTKNVEGRICNLSGKHPEETPIELLHSIHTEDMMGAEKAFHDYFSTKRIKGEWFQLTEEDIECIGEVKEI